MQSQTLKASAVESLQLLPWVDPVPMQNISSHMPSAAEIPGQSYCPLKEFWVMSKGRRNPSSQPATPPRPWIGSLCTRSPLFAKGKAGKPCLRWGLLHRLLEWKDYSVSLQFTCFRCRLTVQTHCTLETHIQHLFSGVYSCFSVLCTLLLKLFKWTVFI